MLNQQKLQKRAQVVKAIRDFFWQAGFTEVETPQLVPLPSMEPYLEVFETKLLDDQRQSYQAFLTSSPEYSMKKLLAHGSGDIFQICKSYRNGEGISPRHNPEFTILEWYRTQADYTAIMDDCESLLAYIGNATNQPQLEYQGQHYDLTKPWQRLSVAQSFEKYAQVDTDTMLSEEKLKKVAIQKGYQITNHTTWEEAFHQIFLNEIEPHLGQKKPTILYDYPIEMAALSRKKKEDPRFAERFEFYIAGLELGNAFSELTNWQEQLKRLQADQAEKKRIGKTVFDIDMEFILALKKGMPPTAGIAVGVDRLAMLFMDEPSITGTLAFPAREIWKDLVK